ncbi:MAG: adenylate/guanylate cyclase domain-containing protein [Pseudomonadota bacterium]
MVERRLSTILAADVASYSRLMGENEEDTLGRLTQHREIVSRLIKQHNGREFGTVGDSVMADFSSPVTAVRCAIEIQTVLQAEERGQPPERIMRWRIGVNLGDVMVEGPDLFGDGVNVAARLQSVAQPGSICIAETVAEQVSRHISVKLDDLGKFRLKNIARPVRAFRIRIGQEELPIEPFRGLAPFDVEHATMFYGRSRAVNETVERLAGQAQGGTAFLLIYGASGTGKSSLLRAGLIPALLAERPGDRSLAWRQAIMRPGDEGAPLQTLLRVLKEAEAVPNGFPPETSAVASPEISQIVSTTLAASQSHLLLAVDQFEELFTLASAEPAEKEEFARTIAALARCSRVWVVATMRGDFYHRCAEVPELADIKDGFGSYELLPPTANEIGQIIREPATRAGLQFETSSEDGSLDDVILADATGQKDVLPLLSFTLSALYERSRSTGLLTFADYRSLGGLQGAVARWAEDVVDRLPNAVAAELPGVLRSLVALAPDSVLTSRPASAQSLALPHVRNELVNALVAARLLVVDEGSTGRKEVRLAHEALLTHWPSARQIIENDRVLLFARTQLAVDVARWVEEDRRPDLLLPAGRRLAEAQDLVRVGTDDLDADTTLFIRTSEQAAQRAEKRRLARVRSFAAAMALLAILAGGVGWFAWLERNEAEEARLIAQAAEERALVARDLAEAERDRSQVALSRLLARRAVEAARANQPGYALRVALAALPNAVKDPTQGADTWQAAQALVEAMAAQRRVGFADPGLGPLRAEFTADGDQFVVGSEAGAVQIWNTSPVAPVGTFQLSDQRIWRASLSPDGTRLVATGIDGLVHVVDMTTKKRMAPLETGTEGTFGVEFSPDGESFATTTQEGAIYLWDTKTLERLLTINTDGGRIWTAAFSPDGALLATASEDGLIRLYHVGDGTLAKSIEGHGQRVWQVAFHPSGTMLASGGLDHTARLWDIESGAEIAVLEGHTDWVTSVAFTNDGKRLITGGADGIAKLWDIDSLAELADFRGHSLRLWTVDVDKDDQRLLTTGHDGTVQLWNVRDQVPVAVMHDRQEAVHDVKYLADGTELATASADGTISHWHFGEGTEQTRLGHHDGAVQALAVSTNNNVLISGGADGALRVWDLEAKTPLLTVRAHGNAVRDLAISTDGDRLISSDSAGEVSLWPLPISGDPIRLPVSSGDAKSVELAKDGTAITASASSGIQFWNADGRLQHEIPANRAGPVGAIGISPDGSILATGGADHQVRIWDMTTQASRRLLKGHTAPVVDLAFSPDGGLLATASTDRTVRLWETATGAALAILKGHSDSVDTVAFSPEGDALITAGADATARVWRTPQWHDFSELIAHAQSLAGADLTPAERRELSLDE